MEDIKSKFGAKIKFYRMSNNMSQEELSEILNIHPRHLSRIETGKSFPSYITLEKLCVTFNIEIKELFNFSSEIYNSELNLTDEICLKINQLKNNQQKLKFISLALDALSNNKKSIAKMQAMLEGMMIL